MQLVGILIGQLFFGFMGDWIGRRYAMLIDMGLILVGIIMLTVANGTSEQVRPFYKVLLAWCRWLQLQTCGDPAATT